MTFTLLPHRRRRRRFAAVPPTPGACVCTVPHPLTAEARAAVEDDIVLARLAGNEDLADYLRRRLTTVCRTGGAKCPCGCGNPPGQHNEMRAA